MGTSRAAIDVNVTSINTPLAQLPFKAFFLLLMLPGTPTSLTASLTPTMTSLCQATGPPRPSAFLVTLPAPSPPIFSEHLIDFASLPLTIHSPPLPLSVFIVLSALTALFPFSPKCPPPSYVRYSCLVPPLGGARCPLHSCSPITRTVW